MRILPTLAVVLAGFQPALAEDAGTLTVTGEGRVEAAPDLATLTLGVMTEAETAAEALRSNSALLEATLTRLRSSGIEERDIQTTGLSLNPRFDYSESYDTGPAQITGFFASNNVTVRVRALDGLGGVLDAVVSDGANSLGGISFGLQDPDPLLDEARREAVADARRKAELYAAAAGVTLDGIVSMSEQSGYFAPVPMDALGKAAEAVPIAGGEVSVTANVTVVWKIAE